MRFLSFFLISLLFFNANVMSMWKPLNFFKKPSKFEQLRKAVIENNLENVKSLIPDFTADELNTIDSNGNTLLLLAIRQENSEMGKLFLEHKADPNIPDKDKHFPLHHVLERWQKGPNKTDFIQELINYEADTQVLLNYYFPITKFFPVRNVSYEDLSLLLKNNPDLANVRINIHRDSILYFAIDTENIPLIQLLIETGADPHKLNSRGETLENMAKKKNLNIIPENYKFPRRKKDCLGILET